MTRYLTVVPNNADGQRIIDFLRKVAKRNGWRVAARGRNANRAQLAIEQVKEMFPNGRYKGQFVSKKRIHNALFWTKLKLQLDVPKKHATSFAVYVYGPNQLNITPAIYNDMLNKRLVK